MKDKMWQRAPWQIVYAPMIPFIAYTFMRKRFRLNSVNPCMDNSGLLNSSKSKYMRLLPDKWTPQYPTKFPFIAKPDKGMRGKGVMIMRDENDYKKLLANPPKDYIYQEYIDLPHECGVFWADNKITSLTLKKFKDGQPIGSHNLGTVFLDGREFITPELNEAFREIVSHLDGFTYGRFDVRYNTFSDLDRLENFKIIEVNGVNSEPTHIYDPGYSLWRAYGDMINHWNLI